MSMVNKGVWEELFDTIRANAGKEQVKTKNLLAVKIHEGDEANLEERRRLRKIHMTEGNWTVDGGKWEAYVRAD